MSRNTLIAVFALGVAMWTVIVVLEAQKPRMMVEDPMPADGSAPPLPPPIEIK